MTEPPKDDEALPPSLPTSLRWLQGLVMILTATLIGGVLTVVYLLVTRMPIPLGRPTLPPALHLPAGANPAAVTMGTGWIAVVTTDNRILLFGPDGQFWQEIAIKKPNTLN